MRATKFRTLWKLGFSIFNLLLILLCIEFRLDIAFPKYPKYVTFQRIYQLYSLLIFSCFMLLRQTHTPECLRIYFCPTVLSPQSACNFKLTTSFKSNKSNEKWKLSEKCNNLFSCLFTEGSFRDIFCLYTRDMISVSMSREIYASTHSR